MRNKHLIPIKVTASKESLIGVGISEDVATQLVNSPYRLAQRSLLNCKIYYKIKIKHYEWTLNQFQIETII